MTKERYDSVQLAKANEPMSCVHAMLPVFEDWHALQAYLQRYYKQNPDPNPQKSKGYY